MTHRRSRWLYPVELATAAALGVAFLLAVLVLLHWIFPGGTRLGDLVRSPIHPSGSAPGATEAGHEASVAVLKGVRHNVQDRPQSSVVWSKATAGEQLGDRHAVQTLADSSATIAFDTDAEIELGERSLIVIRRSANRSGQQRRRGSVLFMDGLLRTRIGAGRRDLELEIATPSGLVRAAPDGGDVQVDLAVNEGAAELSVVAGQVELDWGGKTTLVPEGHFVTYDAAHAPSQPAPLNQPPRVVTPAPGSRWSMGAEPEPVVFEWQALEGAAFRLTIARDAAFEQVVFDQKVSGRRFVHDNLGPGEYHWRVARDPNATQSTSDPAHFMIEEDTDPPQLDVLLPDEGFAGSRILVKGSTEPGSRVFVGDSAVTTRDGRFEFPLDLHDGYNFLVIQAIDPNGRVTFRNHTILARTPPGERVP